jgi:hypothetical protein
MKIILVILFLSSSVFAVPITSGGGGGVGVFHNSPERAIEFETSSLVCADTNRGVSCVSKASIERDKIQVKMMKLKSQQMKSHHNCKNDTKEE